MDAAAQETLFLTFRAVIEDVIADKRKNPRNAKALEDFKARMNIGLHVEEDFVMWVNLVVEGGNYTLSRDRLDTYDLELICDPEDMMYFTNRKYSTLKMMLTKNRFGNRRLRFKGGTTGMNLGKLLKLPKVLVLDKP
ncbi:MAG: hypothetical protein C4K47_04590 [Candidatus Thorarchaeota archaeon]|nr:MAG: hypothetical protein C4K47_04590 [Candidatus Thorarchaeota archaeon]